MSMSSIMHLQNVKVSLGSHACLGSLISALCGFCHTALSRMEMVLQACSPPPALHLLPDEIGDALANHHGSDIGIGPDAVGHDRRIYHPQIVQTMDAAKLIHHGH